VNTGEPWPLPSWAESRVRRMQARLHLWATSDPGRRFDDLYNLIHHPDFLAVAWERVSGSKGARSPGADRVIPAFISDAADVAAFLNDTREQLKARTFTPLPVRERMIPKAGSPGKFRRLGIPSAMDRLVQAALVLVLEPIFEADFKPVSYGFRPKRRAQDAIAEIHAFGSRNYHWVFEADITACFGELAHSAILDRVRLRVGDKRVLALVKSFLKAGIMSEAGQVEGTASGTPQGGIESPLLASIALPVLDEHFCAKDHHGTRWQREKHRMNGGAYYRMIRYAVLCRARHKSAYAEVRVMPTLAAEGPAWRAGRRLLVGITRWVPAVARGCRGTRAGCPVAGSGRGWCRAGGRGRGPAP